MTFLLDANVLIALIDPDHVLHGAAYSWFDSLGDDRRWATCPLTENAVLRIIGNPRYPRSPGSPSAVAQLLDRLRTMPGHEFWPDEISLMGSAIVDPTKIAAPNDVTDTYLLALAVARGGTLATLDRKLSTAAVRGGKAALKVIG